MGVYSASLFTRIMYLMRAMNEPSKFLVDNSGRRHDLSYESNIQLFMALLSNLSGIEKLY